MKKLLLLLPGFVLLFGTCQPENTAKYYRTIQGKTMGTYYKVTYRDSLDRDFFQSVDSLLVAINHEISTYEPKSTISQFNQAEGSFSLGLDFGEFTHCAADPAACGRVKNYHFFKNLLAARVANQRTRQAFDPTVMPLVNYWGFGYTPHKPVEKTDSLKVDSLLQFVGFQKVVQDFDKGIVVLRKAAPGVQLDFGGTGQGYGIDAVAIFLELKGVKNYLVDIGGESRARGRNPKGEWWSIGINTPKPEAALTDFVRVVQLQNRSVSTSGNYRNFYEVNGGKYSHFIDPRTGYPKQGNLLSASVFAKDCLEADALATQLEGIEAMFVYSDEKGNLQIKSTPSVAKMLTE